MTIANAIASAERLLPGTAAPDGEEDPRWQAIIAVGEYIESEPEAVWQFIARWGVHPDSDLRDAIATCLLEHLLGYDFALIFPRAEALALEDSNFAYTVRMCWRFGQAESAQNSKRLSDLIARLEERFSSNP